MKLIKFSTLLVYLAVPLLPYTISAQESKKTKIVILGVNHTTQLLNKQHQPAAIRAYINKVKPAAIGIELFPEEYVRNDFYEYTYEQQYVVVPYAKDKQIPIHPFDWKPSDEDLILAFGTSDMEVGNFTRRSTGFHGFLNFQDSTFRNAPFYFAEELKYSHEIFNWYSNYPEDPTFDFARRLYLYRTYLQAKRIEKIARNYTGRTLLIIVGYFHKNDIEKILAGNKSIEIVKSSIYGEIDQQDIDENIQTIDDYAIATFNLLGTQSHLGFDTVWVTDVADRLLKSKAPEAELFKIRLDLLTQKIKKDEAIQGYKRLLENISSSTTFTWTGVKYADRIDSFVDPFGNMTIKQRILVELVRENYKAGHITDAERYRDLLEKNFSGKKLYMLKAYLNEYIFI